MKRAWAPAFLAVAGLLSAGEPPSAEAILDKALEATGGKAAHEKIKTASMKLVLRMPGEDVEISVIKLFQAPDLFYSRSELMGMVTETGYDGKEGWCRNTLSGTRTLTPAEMQALRSESPSGYDWKVCFKEAAVQGKEAVDGKECYRILLTPKDEKGASVLRWYEASSGLLLKEDAQKVVSTYSDYREVDGVRIPFEMHVSAEGSEMVMKLEEARYNVEVDASKFKKP